MIGDLLLKGRLFSVRLHFEVYSDLNRHIRIIFSYKLPYVEICIYIGYRITRFVYVQIVDKKTVVARSQQPLRIVRGINAAQPLPDV